MPEIASSTSYSQIKAAYSSSLSPGIDAYKKSSVADLSSSAYRVEISDKGRQKAQADLNIEQNREQSEFKRTQNQRSLNFQRNSEAEEQEFKRNQRQDEINFKQKMQQEEAEFNKTLRQEASAFERKQRQEASQLAMGTFSVSEAS